MIILVCSYLSFFFQEYVVDSYSSLRTMSGLIKESHGTNAAIPTIAGMGIVSFRIILMQGNKV